jgi:predicted ArsR family transcriptional regulator
MRRQQDIARVALLDEPARRVLYDYVRDRTEPVGRDEAAHAAGISRSLAAFHLDRLVTGGLLEAEYRRISGRTGRGAGRPAKLYRPTARRVEVSVPETRYDIAGAILVRSLAARTGVSGRRSVAASAERRGRELGRELAGQVGEGSDLLRAARGLTELGFHPERRRSAIRLRNCPFHVLVEENTELVCALNHSLLSGLLDGLACFTLQAEDHPGPGACCVRITAASPEMVK